MVRSPSSSAGATARSRTACRSHRGGITRYVSSAREQKSSTARGCFRWHNPRVEADALLFMPASRHHEPSKKKRAAPAIWRLVPTEFRRNSVNEKHGECPLPTLL